MARRHSKHNYHLSKTPEFWVWVNMRRRCGAPRATGFHNYGGRGITVCDRWQQFPEFYADMGPRPSPTHQLERLDNDGAYCPENCVWSTAKEQANNKRTNRLLTLHGETHSLSEWATQLGVPREALFHRLLKLHWSVERTLTTPIKPYRLKAMPGGESAAAVARRHGIPPTTFRMRLYSGWSVERALSTPLLRQR